MALQNNMELFQIKSFLEDEVKEQVFLEIAPILYIGQPAGGYFGVTRQILCFVDFLGALYCGYDKKEKNEDLKKYKRMRISKSEKVEKFISEFFGSEIDPKYRENGKVFYQMYRHGLVHLYQPKTIKQKAGRILSWAIYKGGRESHPEAFDTQEGKFIIPNARHLDIVVDPRNQNCDLLTISITCLYKDLLTVIDRFYQKVNENKKNELGKWREATNAILESENGN